MSLTDPDCRTAADGLSKISFRRNLVGCLRSRLGLIDAFMSPEKGAVRLVLDETIRDFRRKPTNE